jgi:hypothetical protein
MFKPSVWRASFVVATVWVIFDLIVPTRLSGMVKLLQGHEPRNSRGVKAMRLLKCFLVLATAWNGWGAAANAQLVEVGPGYVRAPFVRVYTYPGGGSYVRAPFVSRFSPGFPGAYADSFPMRERFDEMSWSELCRQVRESCAQLESDLARFRSGNFWRTSLKTDEIAAFVSVDSDYPPAESVRRQLTDILATYQSIGDAPDFNRVAQLGSFQALRAALSEYVMLPELRLRLQLSSAARELRQSLGRYNTGAGWQDYLLVSPNMPLSEVRLRQSEPVTTTELADALARFDSASQNPEYDMISNLPAFKTVHARLATYFDERQAPSTPPAEELPAPEPAAKQ